MTSKKPLQVAIVMGSASDQETLKNAETILSAFGIAYETRILSAHRTPDALKSWLADCEKRGVQLFIAAAGMAAHLAGVVAAHTLKPVIGVPLSASSLDGLDALLSTVQMPAGVPVATVAIGKAGAKNAAYLAIQILSLSDPKLAKKLKADREKQAKTILKSQLK